MESMKNILSDISLQDKAVHPFPLFIKIWKFPSPFTLTYGIFIEIIHRDHSYSFIHTRVYQVVRNISFSENFSYVLNE